jgi:hypothetical protein
MKKPLKWLPLYVDPWLFGSTRHELTRAQRGDFIDLLLVSAKDSGYIRANETTPYPIAQLAGLLCVPADELQGTIEACVRHGKIRRLENGILYVANWETYKLTPQYRRRLEASPLREEREKRGEESKGNGNNGSKKGTSESSPSEDLDTISTPIPKTLPLKLRDKIVELRLERKTLSERIGRMRSKGETCDSQGHNLAEMERSVANIDADINAIFEANR